MMRCYYSSYRTPKLWTLALLAVALLGTAYADKKKPVATENVKLSDQRSKAYFDLSKIVWPNPPAIARIKFLDLFTGQKVDPNLFSKKKQKAEACDG